MMAALRSPPLTLNVKAVLVDDDVREDCIGVVLRVEDLAQDDVPQILGHRLPLGRVHVHVEVHSHALLAVAENKCNNSQHTVSPKAQRWIRINLISEDGAEVLSSKKVPEMASLLNVCRLPYKICVDLRHLLDFILALFF